MGRSKAQKHRRHLIRNGCNDPARKRGFQVGFSMHERTTPSKQEKQERQARKYRPWRHGE